MSRRATCSCGQLSIEVTADPSRISVCHCLTCQRRTGSAFAAQARFPRDAARITGTSTAWVRTNDTGSSATFHFCPTCGATVHYDLSTMPDVIAIPLGAFADPAFPPPTVSVYEVRKHAWIEITADVEHLD